MSILPDSGDRRKFATGSVRDRGDLKPRPDLISPFALMEVGELMRLGADKYSLRNWELGQPFSEMTASMLRHVLQWVAGEDSENHLAAVVFNAQAIMHYREMIRRGLLPPQLNDMPSYRATDENCNRRHNGEAVEDHGQDPKKLKGHGLVRWAGFAPEDDTD